MTIPAFDDRPPFSDKITDYDERHFVTYLRLLDAAAEGADWREAVQIIFGLSAADEPNRSQMVHDTHLERARWMTAHGYRQLLEKAQTQTMRSN
jgi:predicted secreted protein